MKRKIYNTLVEWKNSKDRKPLLIVGSRQVGKTYIINEFGKNEYENLFYCNLEKQKHIRKIFDDDLEPLKIISDLEKVFEKRIDPNTSLIIFDEIQACPSALTSLKYFNEEHKEFHIIASGSLLGVAINRGGFSFPVGQIKTLKLFPLDFEEFLWANNQESSAEEIRDLFNKDKQASTITHNYLIEWYKKYLYVGGMPESVNEFVNTNNLLIVREKQNEIINNYVSDMSKYNSAPNTTKSILIFNNVTKQLAKENKKFKYSILKIGARASEYESALNWICTSGITNQCFKLEEVKYPINVYSSSSDFKLYLNDVGLLCALHKISWNKIMSDKNELNEFRGGLTENYVFNQLLVNKLDSFYWTSGNSAEVDFITTINENIIPIEVKSNTNNHSQSLNLYRDKFKPKYSIRITAKNFGFENGIKSVPLYAVFCIK